MWTRCLRGNHVECCQGRCGAFHHRAPNKKPAKGGSSSQPSRRGGRVLQGGGLCAVLRLSMPETLGARRPCGLGWGPQGSRAPVEVSQEVAGCVIQRQKASTSGDRLEAGWLLPCVVYFWCGNHFDKISFYREQEVGGGYEPVQAAL